MGINGKDFFIQKLTRAPQNMEQSNMMWDKRAAEFAKGIKSARKDAFIEFLKKHVEIEGSEFLDIGCGAARYIKLLLDEGAVVEGIEPSKEMIRQANLYLESHGYEKRAVLHNLAFQDFDLSRQYDYVFLSNSPVTSYYENYLKFIKLAKKGICMNAWLKTDDSLFNKLCEDLGINAQAHGSMNISYMFYLFIEDFYQSAFQTLVNEREQWVEVDEVCQRYASWLFKEEYSEKHVEEVKRALSKYEEEGKLYSKITNLQGMLFVDVTKKLK